MKNEKNRLYDSFTVKLTQYYLNLHNIDIELSRISGFIGLKKFNLKLNIVKKVAYRIPTNGIDDVVLKWFAVCRLSLPFSVQTGDMILVKISLLVRNKCRFLAFIIVL